MASLRCVSGASAIERPSMSGSANGLAAASILLIQPRLHSTQTSLMVASKTGASQTSYGSPGGPSCRALRIFLPRWSGAIATCAHLGQRCSLDILAPRPQNKQVLLEPGVAL